MPMPKPLTIPFARDALSQFINEIPDTPQSGADPQLASWSEGFSPITMQPLTSGGKPPEGPDFNGILSALSEHIVFQNGGGIYTFSQEYVDKTGGYDKDSVLIGDDGSALWVSLTDDNAENFNTANPVTKWVKISTAGVEQQIEDILSALAIKADETTQVIAGTGLSGGGNLSASRTLSIDPANAAEALAMTSDDKVITPKALQMALRPSITGSITLNGTTDNTVVVSDIATELGLEVGDVIRIDTGAYNKLHTVESIANNNSIIVNYEHAGNRGDGSLKLPDFTGQATVTRVAKWFNAPIGLGQAWVNLTRQTGVNITNSTNRNILIWVRGRTNDSAIAVIDGESFANTYALGGGNAGISYMLSVQSGGVYSLSTMGDAAVNNYREMR